MAVRSRATAEDLPDASFAGQQCGTHDDLPNRETTVGQVGEVARLQALGQRVAPSCEHAARQPSETLIATETDPKPARLMPKIPRLSA